MSGQQCCDTTRQDLAAAHQRVAELERTVLAQNAQISSLTTQLATVSLDRDNWRRAHANTVIQHLKGAA